MVNLYPASTHYSEINGNIIYGGNIDTACHEIHNACKGFGTDEKKLTTILGSKSADDRFMIACRYKEIFNKSLKDLVKSETSGHYGKLLQLICVPVPELEAQILRDATKGIGTNENLVYPIISGRSNTEMNILKKSFYNLVGKDLVVTLNSELSGNFKKFIIACLQETKEEFNPTIHTEQSAEVDADILYKAGQGRLGTDEKTFIKIICSRPNKQVEKIDQIYARKYGYTLEKAIEKEFSGDIKKAMLYSIRIILEPFECIADEFEKTMKGIGTDEVGLSTATTRYQSLLPQVKDAYEKKYKKKLRDRIHGETSGDYRMLLLAMIDAPTSPAIGIQSVVGGSIFPHPTGISQVPSNAPIQYMQPSMQQMQHSQQHVQAPVGGHLYPAQAYQQQMASGMPQNSNPQVYYPQQQITPNGYVPQPFSQQCPQPNASLQQYPVIQGQQYSQNQYPSHQKVPQTIPPMQYPPQQYQPYQYQQPQHPYASQQAPLQCVPQNYPNAQAMYGNNQPQGFYPPPQ